MLWLPDPPPQRPSFPITERAASSPVVLRDQRGTIIGRLEEQRLTGKVVARDARGVLLGVYDKQHAGPEPVLWTTNERLRAKANLDQRDFISPKAHGRNDLMHYKRVAWLAAMKASKFEIGTLHEVCGITSADLTEWREFNAMYQCVMPCVLRDFSSAEPVVIYVFSRKQAEYLKSRLGGIIQKVPGIVIDTPMRCIHEDGPMTEKERSKAMYWRRKMQTAGVSDVRLLPKAHKLSDREIGLVNATFTRMTTDSTSVRIAA